MIIRGGVANDLKMINLFLNDMHMLPYNNKSFFENYRFSFLIEEESELIGFIIFTILVEEAELEAIYVVPKKRGKGYGNILIEKLLEVCTHRDCKKIFLEVREYNEEAINLYRKYNFSHVNRRLKYYGNEDGLVMCKELR